VALPSLADVVLVIIILIPGFISLSLFRWLAVYEKEISDDQMRLMSLVCSLFIYGIFSNMKNISDIDKFRDVIFIPSNLILILSIGIGVGAIPGLVIKYGWRHNITSGDCWDIVMKKASRNGTWVTVYTNDDNEYMGALNYSGCDNDPRDITIRSPTKIIRNDEGDLLKEVEMGKEVFFPEHDIKRVVFYKEV